MILLLIYIILSVISIITGILSGIRQYYSKKSYPYNKTPWYWEIYTGFIVPLLPLIIVGIILYIFYRVVINLYNYGHRRIF